jgi:hypothetical protein
VPTHLHIQQHSREGSTTECQLESCLFIIWHCGIWQQLQQHQAGAAVVRQQSADAAAKGGTGVCMAWTPAMIGPALSSFCTTDTS